MMIKNLAQFKRALKVGVKLKSKYLLNGDHEWINRKVVNVTTVGVYMQIEGTNKMPFLEFGKASEYEFRGDHIIAKWPDGTPFAEYLLKEKD